MSVCTRVQRLFVCPHTQQVHKASLGLELVSDCRLAWLGPLRITSADAILGVSRQCYWLCGEALWVAKPGCRDQ